MVKKWTDDFGTVHYGTQAPREFRVGDEVETLDGRRGVVLSVACAGIYVVYVGFQDGVSEWYSRDGRAPLRHSADNPGNIRHRHPAAPEPADVEAIIADVLAAHEARRDENARLRERIGDVLLIWIEGEIQPGVLEAGGNISSYSMADRILALIAEQPAAVVMPEEPPASVLEAPNWLSDRESVRAYRTFRAALKDAGR